jgi:hypothetical protein
MTKTFDYHNREWVEIEFSASGGNSCRTFDYSDQEWTEIELSAQPVRKGPLTGHERHRLRQAGVLYLALSTSMEFLKQDKRVRNAKSEKIRKSAASLLEELVDFDARNNAKKFGRPFLQSLAKLRDDPPVLAPKNPPREDYYREIFSVWIDNLGGTLKLSRTADTHKLGGPLIRFFQAVTNPVLGTEAPALESICDIVCREKERRKKRRSRGGQALVQLVGFAERPAPKSYTSYTDDGRFSYTDLGLLRMQPDVPFDEQAHDYVIARGRATGAQHIVAVDADGTVLSHGFGTPNVGIPKELNDALLDPASKIVIHHNHPCNTGLSNTDIAFLGFPGLEAIWAHENGGNVAFAALTPQSRAMLRRLAPDVAWVRLYRMAHRIGLSLYGPLRGAIDAHKISVSQAK